MKYQTKYELKICIRCLKNLIKNEGYEISDSGYCRFHDIEDLTKEIEEYKKDLNEYRKEFVIPKWEKRKLSREIKVNQNKKERVRI